MKSIMFFLMTLLSLFAFSQGNESSKTKISRSKIYIDLSITQPNIEDCFPTYISSSKNTHDWAFVYPNPSNGIFSFVFNLQNSPQPVKISIYNVLGKLMYEITYKNPNYPEKITIDVSFLNKGIYFIHLNSINQKMIKNIFIY